ncbi:hypothetical protein HD554DRAFT_2168849 [Boletus coccyginus]|nr:hypothetical protein HD554DRAFT_2168849 [Boletus coccyginus]
MAPSVGHHRLSLAILAAVLISVGPIGIVAQTSTAVCLSSFNWMTNSKGQNPCVVSAYLEGACSDGQYTIDPLPTGYYYPGPYADEGNQLECECSSVTYNTMSACGLCQNSTIIGWSVWNTNCTTLYPGFFPLDIPAGTAVPQWAFQDVTKSDLFNVTLAQSVGDNPESTALNTAQSTGSVNPVSTVASASLTASPSPTAIDTASSGGGSSTAAIVGGVVGGVVGLALIAAVVFFVMKKKRSQTPPSAHFTAPTSSAPPSGVYTDTTPFVPQMAQPRLYDPSDPGTFPASPPSTTIRTGSSHGVQHTVNYSTSSMQPGGYYTGLPTI